MLKFLKPDQAEVREEGSRMAYPKILNLIHF